MKGTNETVKVKWDFETIRKKAEYHKVNEVTTEKHYIRARLDPDVFNGIIELCIRPDVASYKMYKDKLINAILKNYLMCLKGSDK